MGNLAIDQAGNDKLCDTEEMSPIGSALEKEISSFRMDI